MLSVVIAAEQPQWPVVSTLAALVPGAASGLVRDVVLVDRHGDRELADIADVAGCELHVARGSRGAALATGARIARGPWLLFIAPGAVIEPGWTDEAAQFIETAQLSGATRAATFLRAHDARAASFGDRLRTAMAILGHRGAAEGLLIDKSFYDALGGHRSEAADPERDLISRIGRRQYAILRARLTLQAGRSRFDSGVKKFR
jgi:hypothetical protein